MHAYSIVVTDMFIMIHSVSMQDPEEKSLEDEIIMIKCTPTLDQHGLQGRIRLPSAIFCSRHKNVASSQLL